MKSDCVMPLSTRDFGRKFTTTTNNDVFVCARSVRNTMGEWKVSNALWRRRMEWIGITDAAAAKRKRKSWKRKLKFRTRDNAGIDSTSAYCPNVWQFRSWLITSRKRRTRYTRRTSSRQLVGPSNAISTAKLMESQTLSSRIKNNDWDKDSASCVRLTCCVCLSTSSNILLPCRRCIYY